MKIQIADLDGCLSNDVWRRTLIKPRPADGSNPEERFFHYHSQCWRDEMANGHELLPNTEIVILTARPVAHRDSTLHWLRWAHIRPHWVIHRNNGDTRPSVDVKRDQLKWLLDVNSYGVKLTDIVLAIDDLEPIVKMYREEFGLNAKLVRIGEEEHLV